jgi:hypothetical protein
MIRTLRMLITLNLALAILVVVAFMAYGLLSGLHIDQQFLLWKPWKLGRAGGPKLPAWTFYAFFESIVVVAFFFSYYIKENVRGHRAFCLVIGGVILFGILFGWLQPLLQIRPPISDEGDILPRPTFASTFPPYWSRILTVDGCLAIYVWCSHVLYGLLGIKDD